MNQDKIIHNLRNPLNTIAMNAELGKLLVQKNPEPEKLLNIFDIILKECKSCSEQLTLLRQTNPSEQSATDILASIGHPSNPPSDD